MYNLNIRDKNNDTYVLEPITRQYLHLYLVLKLYHSFLINIHIVPIKEIEQISFFVQEVPKFSYLP